MYIIFNVESVALKKSKSLHFVGKEKFFDEWRRKK